MSNKPRARIRKTKQSGAPLTQLQIPLGQLCTDAPYQRGEKNKINRMATDFRWSDFGVIIVGKRANGDTFVVDGKQRITALWRVFNEEIDFGLLSRAEANQFLIPCAALTSAGVPMEARLFVGLNSQSGRANVDAQEVHNALLQADDPDTIAFAKMVTDAGRTVGRAGPTTIACIARLREAFAQDRAALERVFPLCCKLFEGSSIPFWDFDVPFRVERHINRYEPSQSLTEWRTPFLNMNPTALDEELRKIYFDGRSHRAINKTHAMSIFAHILNKGTRGKKLTLVFTDVKDFRAKTKARAA